MARSSTNTNTNIYNPISSPESFSSYPIGFTPLEDIPEYLDTWAPEGIIVSAESLGAFRFFAKQQNWFADTPSGWMEKFLRWESTT